MSTGTTGFWQRRRTDLLRAPTKWHFAEVVLVGANLIPIFGLLFLDWTVGEIMLLYWLETGMIGLYTVPKLLLTGKPEARSGWPGFLALYGMFMVGHLLFIYFLFIAGSIAKGSRMGGTGLTWHSLQQWPPSPQIQSLLLNAAALLCSHTYNFFAVYRRNKEYQHKTVTNLIMEPFGRIFFMHFTLIGGGWLMMILESPVGGVIALVGLKTALDLLLYRSQQPTPKPASTAPGAQALNPAEHAQPAHQVRPVHPIHKGKPARPATDEPLPEEQP